MILLFFSFLFSIPHLLKLNRPNIMNKPGIIYERHELPPCTLTHIIVRSGKIYIFLESFSYKSYDKYIVSAVNIQLIMCGLGRENEAMDAVDSTINIIRYIGFFFNIVFILVLYSINDNILTNIVWYIIGLTLPKT